MKRSHAISSLALCLVLPKVAAAQAVMPLFLGNDATLESIIGNVIKALLGVSGALALIMVIYGGFIWMTAQGTPDKIKKAKGTITWALIGLVVAFSAYTLVDFIVRAL